MRAFGVWLLIVLVAVINGGIRQALISPRTGRHARARDQHDHAVRGDSAAVLGDDRMDAARHAAGGLVDWCLVVTLTFAFEFLAGHYVFGTPWRQLLADYNIFRGRIWLLVLVTTAIAPWLAVRCRRLPLRNG